ncbi:putative outer membrane protein [Nonlabens ulvanivorans]|nr:putative outer membrane protein [Nonlabens ulvanivorans]
MLLVIALTSCEDATDITQQGELNEEIAFQTIEDLQSGMVAVYGAYNPDAGSNGTGNALFLSAIFGDNVKSGLDSNGQGNQLFQFILQPSSSPAQNIWSNRYATINFANRTLRASETLSFDPGSVEETKKNHITGQLLALRALCHFELMQYYTVDTSDESSLAVPLFDFVPNVDVSYTRATVGETYDFIENDLLTAQSLLDSTDPDFDNVFYINTNAVLAIQAEVSLYRGNSYGNTIILCDAVLGNVPLASPANYVSMWEDTGDAEEIFTLSRGQGEASIGQNFYFNAPDATGGAFLEVSDELIGLLQPDDIRSSVITRSELNTGAGVLVDLITKYPGSGDGVLINDYKVYRSGEIQLIKAEAQARNNDLPGAASTIKELRDIRFATAQPLPSYTTLDDALLDILNERRLELAFEAQRYLDIKRIGSELNLGMTRDASDCATFNSGNCSLASGDFRFTLPIPQNELNANSIITQNPQY